MVSKKIIVDVSIMIVVCSVFSAVYFIQLPQTPVTKSNSNVSISSTTPVLLPRTSIAQNMTVNLPSGIINYVSIIITNHQTMNTPIPFQQRILINSLYYKEYEADNLQNIDFFNASGSIIPSWLESGNTNTATNTIYWVKLTTSIPSNSNMTIFMGFASQTMNLFNNKTTGEAPQLSPSYAEYDTGYNIFNFYDNFNSTISTSNSWNGINTTTTRTNYLGLTFSGTGYYVTNNFYSPNTGFDADVISYNDVVDSGYIATNQPVGNVINGWAGAFIRSACINIYPDQWSNLTGEANSCGGTYGSLIRNQTSTAGIFTVDILSSTASMQYINYGLGNTTQQPITVDYPIYPAHVGFQSRNNAISIQWVRVRNIIGNLSSTSVSIITKPNIQYLFKDLTPDYQTSSSVGNFNTYAWNDMIYYADNGYLTVGGDGLTFFSNTTFFSPSITHVIGFLSGAAWNGKQFLVVGDKYHPSDGVLMYAYDPVNNTVKDLTNIFDPSLSTNASLLQTVWNGTAFIILGFNNDKSINGPSTILYSYNPVTNVLKNLTSILPASFMHINFASMVNTPEGIFILENSNLGVKLGQLINNTFIDLTNELPIEFTIKDLGIGNTRGLLDWYNGNLLIAGNYINNSIAILSYNSVTHQVLNYNNLFGSISDVIDAITVSNGYCIVGGFVSGSTTTTALYAFNTTNVLYNITSDIPSTYTEITGLASNNNQVFVSNGAYSHVQYGMLYNPSSKYNIIFNEEGLPNGTVWKITLNNVTIYSSTSSISFQESLGSYNYIIGTIPNYLPSISSGSIQIYFTDLKISIQFIPSTNSSSSTISELNLTSTPGFELEFVLGPLLAVIIFRKINKINK